MHLCHTGSFFTRYSSSSTETSTAVGTETSAPGTPASADPSSNATRIANPGWSITDYYGGLSPQCNYGGETTANSVTLNY